MQKAVASGRESCGYSNLDECAFAMVPCPNHCKDGDTDVLVVRYKLETHLKECPNRKYQCPHCDKEGMFQEINTTHLETCPEIEVPCPNDCGSTIKRCKVENHCTKCPNEELTCKYAEIGCPAKRPRRDMEQHEIEERETHLNYAMDAIIKLKKPTAHVFKMNDFDHYKRCDGTWRSPPFYSHPGGYKMYTHVDANRIREGKGTHISVRVYIMDGENDDHLIWPFRGEVTVELLNQLADKNHHTVIMSSMSHCSEDILISHSNLGYNTEKNTQYLKDDCLYFRVSTVVSASNKPWLTCTTA